MIKRGEVDERLSATRYSRPKLGLTRVLVMIVVFFTVGLLPMNSWVASIRWHDIRGSFLVDASTWPTVRGAILESETYTDENRYGSYLHYRIEYEFSVQGRVYHSNQITFDAKGDADANFAESIVARYPVGARIIVFYDPRNPSYSVLEPGSRGNYWFLVGQILAGISLVLFWLLRGLLTRRWSIMWLFGE